MSKDIRQGRWLQLRGRAKALWGNLVGDDATALEGNADVLTGTIQESYGVAKKETLGEVSRRIDAFARVAKKTARSIAR
jgi:uncharacterized protein YjbJ (UPF0337 family)